MFLGRGRVHGAMNAGESLWALLHNERGRKDANRRPFFGMWDVQDSKGRKENMPVACF